MRAPVAAGADPRGRPGLWRRLRAALRRLGRKGIASVEFGVVTGLASTMILGSAEAAKYFMTVESVRAASAEAVRIAMLRGSTNVNGGVSPCQGMVGRVSGLNSRVRFLDPNRLTATMFGCVTNNGTSRVNISVSYQYTFTIPVLGRSSEVLTETSQAVFH